MDARLFVCVFDVSLLRSFAKKYKTETDQLMPKVKRLAFHSMMIVLSSMERVQIYRGVGWCLRGRWAESTPL